MTQATKAVRAEIWGGIAALVLLVALFHGPSLRNEFVYDDAWTIVENPILRAPVNLPSLLGTGPARDLVPDAGRPSLLFTEIIDYALWGLSPPGFHLQNLLWHAGVSILVFLGLCAFTHSFSLALTASAIFAIHPINVEAVAAINYREDLLAAFFCLASLGAIHLARARQGGGVFRMIAFAALMLGVFAKENASMAAVLLVTLDVVRKPDWHAGDLLRKYWRDYLPLAVPALVAFLWRAWVMGAPAIVSRTADVAASHQDPLPRIAASAWAFASGLGQFFLPFGFSADYATATSNTLLPGALAGAAVIASAVLLCRHRRSRPWIAAGGLWAVVAYLPNLGFIPLTNIRADRYFYLPSVGLALCAAVVFATVCGRFKGLGERRFFDLPVPWTIFTLLVALLGMATLRQGRVWRNDLTLWTSATIAVPDAPGAWAALAEAHLRRGQTVQAMAAADRSLRLSEDGHTRELRGVILLEQGAFEPARAELKRALDAADSASRPERLNNLGMCEWRLGHVAQALALFDEAVRLAPGYERPRLNSAQVRSEMVKGAQ